jgi:RNA polymerase sigma-70 factor (ECF subfamily)
LNSEAVADAELVRRAQAGDRGARAELVCRWAAAAVAVCQARVGRLGMAEDLAQEALLRALRALPTLRDAESFGPWLRGIAARACLDWLKSRRETPFSAMNAGGGEFDRAADDAEPASTLAADDDRARLRRLVDRLPDDLRETLILYYAGGETHASLAARFGVTKAAINQRLTRARAWLRERMAEVERR